MVYIFKVIHNLTTTSFVLHKKMIRSTRLTNNANKQSMKFHNVKRVAFKLRFRLEQSENGILLTDTLELGMENLTSFESVMQGYCFTALERIYDCDDPRKSN